MYKFLDFYINIWYSNVVTIYGGIGEVVNTADCGSVMQGFDSLISPHERIISEI